MRIMQFVVDAFTDRVFQGNPAAVCPLQVRLDDYLLQAIAAENNLSETAFLVPARQGFELRWFTPVAEVRLCGHATLATAHVLFSHLGYAGDKIRFFTKSGELVVEKKGHFLEMHFPASYPSLCEPPAALGNALGGDIQQCLSADDYMVVYPAEQDILAITPDYELLKTLPLRGVMVTAPGDNCDFVSRFFAPKLGIAEDPVTGSAHCQLAPYWSGRLGREDLFAVQLSARGGQLHCRVDGTTVHISGQAVTFSQGEIFVD